MLPLLLQHRLRNERRRGQRVGHQRDHLGLGGGAAAQERRRARRVRKFSFIRKICGNNNVVSAGIKKYPPATEGRRLRMERVPIYCSCSVVWHYSSY